MTFRNIFFRKKNRLMDLSKEIDKMFNGNRKGFIGKPLFESVSDRKTVLNEVFLKKYF